MSSLMHYYQCCLVSRAGDEITCLSSSCQVTLSMTSKVLVVLLSLSVVRGQLVR